MSKQLRELVRELGGVYVQATDNTPMPLKDVGPADVPADTKKLLRSRFRQTSYYKYETKFPGGLLLRVTFQTNASKTMSVRVENGPNESVVIGIPNWPQNKLKKLVGLVSRLDSVISDLKEGA